MAKHKRLVCLLFMMSCASGSILLAALRTQSQDAPQKKQLQKEKVIQAEKVDISQFPVVDYPATGPTDPKERARREVKGKKYNNQPVRMEKSLLCADPKGLS